MIHVAQTASGTAAAARQRLLVGAERATATPNISAAAKTEKTLGGGVDWAEF